MHATFASQAECAAVCDGLLFVVSVPQAYISRARVDSFSLTADMMYVASNAPRIARALFEIVARQRWSNASEMLLKLCKVRGACWYGKSHNLSVLQYTHVQQVLVCV